VTPTNVTHLRSSKRDRPSQITATVEEIAPQNRQQRRHPEPPIVVAVHAPYTSRRGLTHDLYFARCRECGYYRRYQALGLRICPCGAHHRLVQGSAIV
jgi:hypothetical protein